MNEVLVSTIRSRMYAGADVTESEKKILHMSKVPRLSLRGKGAVYYRKVYNRPVEIIHCVWFPKKASDITRFAKERLEPIERFHQDGLTLIPEYIDLQMKIQEDNRKDLKSIDDLFQKQNSYNIFMAIYNWKTRQVEHYHYGWLDWMLSEGGYMHIINSKNDIEKTIQDYMRHHEALVNNRW
jgi:hypothetical protein